VYRQGGICLYDVAVIGAGVSGCSVAYYLASYRLKVVILEKDADVCEGTSKANTAIVHAGFDAEPGSDKCRYNVAGNAMFDELCAELDVPFRRNGTLLVHFEGQRPDVEKLIEQGKSYGVPGLRYVEKEELKTLCPNLTNEACGALLAESGGIVSPYELTIAMAENAVLNGAGLLVGAAVRSVEKRDGSFLLDTSLGPVEARSVVNCAGVYADVFNNQLSRQKLSITPRKGEYLILDKIHGGEFSVSVCTMPVKKATGHTKGVWIAPTVSGNILLGPTALDQPDREDVSNTAEGFAEILEKSKLLWPKLPVSDVIGCYAGLRAHSDRNDFLIGEAPDCEGFFNCAAIESPGLTSAPAFGKKVAHDVALRLGAEKRTRIPGRDRVYKPFRYMSDTEREEAIKDDPRYGRIVCRCENVTEAEIRGSIRRAAGAWTLDAVKRRTRAGMGRCQSGFCCTRVMQIISEETGIPLDDISKFGVGSEILRGSIFNSEEAAQ